VVVEVYDTKIIEEQSEDARRNKMNPSPAYGHITYTYESTFQPNSHSETHQPSADAGVKATPLSWAALVMGVAVWAEAVHVN